MQRRITLPRYQPCTRSPRSSKAAASTGRSHGSEEGSPKIWWSQVREGREQERRECDAASEARHVEARQERSWRQGEEPQASDRHRALGGAKKGREGAPQAHVAQTLVT